MQVALLFPGQGAQTPGFLRRLPQHPALQATLNHARQILNEELDQLDSAAALKSTVAVQLCTVIAGVATARALSAAGAPRLLMVRSARVSVVKPIAALRATTAMIAPASSTVPVASETSATPARSAMGKL